MYTKQELDKAIVKGNKTVTITNDLYIGLEELKVDVQILETTKARICSIRKGLKDYKGRAIRDSVICKLKRCKAWLRFKLPNLL
jgi:hypothetical protein